MAIALACTSCQERLTVKDTLAGKRVKCPACGEAVQVPPSSRGDSEREPSSGAVNGKAVTALAHDNVAETADTPPDDAPAGDTDWGESILLDQDVPDGMRSEIREVLRGRERITWATRARMDMLLATARILRIVGIVILCICAAMALTGLPMLLGIAGFLVFAGFSVLWVLIPAFVMLLPGAVLALIGTVGMSLMRLPQRMEANAPTRPVYLLAGRRLVIHPGLGMDLPLPRWMKAIQRFFAERFGKKKFKAALGVTPYGYADLTKLHRIEAKKFPGAGDIVLGLNDIEQSTLYRMVGVDNVKQVERLIRETILHPAVDELLSGQRTVADLRRGRHEPEAGAEGVESTALAPEQDVREVLSTSRPRASAKQERTLLISALDEVADDLAKQVEAELTAGEEVLWIGQPQADVKGRGVVGALLGKAVRKEPAYQLYALTNRRVLLWATKDTSVDAGPGAHQYRASADMALRGPLSYYSTDLLRLGLEEDPRIDGGGSIVFKSMHITITTTRTKGGRGPGKKSHSAKHEVHCFGILRIRNVRPVLRLLYERLLAPCR